VGDQFLAFIQAHDNVGVADVDAKESHKPSKEDDCRYAFDRKAGLREWEPRPCSAATEAAS
jgi:hypothetical protein